MKVKCDHGRCDAEVEVQDRALPDGWSSLTLHACPAHAATLRVLAEELGGTSMSFVDEEMRRLVRAAGLQRRSCAGCGVELEAYSRDEGTKFSCHACDVAGAFVARVAESARH